MKTKHLNLLLALVLCAGIFLPVRGAFGQNLRAASFHPLITDIAAQVGGDRVRVDGILTVDDDPHTFDPTSSDLSRVAAARLVLISGKGLETYLDALRDNLAPGQEIVDVGRKVPSITITAGELFVCCPAHSQGSIDPHWWHSPARMKRAAGTIADAFAAADPAGKATYAANEKAVRARLDALEDWAKVEVAKIPRSGRKLVTAHAAFGYLCKDFGFKSVPVRGLTHEREPSAKYLAETIAVIRDVGVTTVFPETSANPKVLEELVRATGARTGGSLVADGTGDRSLTTYDAWFRHNINTIVAGLAP